MKKVIAVTGGIGAGKSVVCRMLRSMGYAVYDCDLEARFLMDRNAEMRRRIANEISPDAITPDGSICRPNLSKCVFSDPAKLRLLNEIVHGAVRAHLAKWIEKQKGDVVFVETAILHESGLDKMVCDVWEVTAPVPVRIERVMKRSGLSKADVEKRIAAQSSGNSSAKVITNDGSQSVIPQIIRLLHSI